LIEAKDGEQWTRLLTDRADEVEPRPPQGLRKWADILLQLPFENEDEVTKHLVLMINPQQSSIGDPETVRASQTLEQHTKDVEEYVKKIGKALNLDRELQEALVIAARWHDKGKARPIWQYFAYNSDTTAPPLAKSEKYRQPPILGGFRHEFGSLLDATAQENIRNHPEHDLILHLIAAHHGWARPHFEPNARDSAHTPDENEEAAIEVMRRFGRLQQRFGRWGLAWLESLLRCADIAASKSPSMVPVPAESEEVKT
jgi:CRISPR-associated endonuclease/helicase Cas3